MTRITAALMTLATCALSATAHAQDTMPELTGTWTSMACELRPQAGPEGVQPWYLTREVVFSPGRIAAHFVTYADPACRAPLLDLRFSGDVQVRGPSDVAEGAREVDLIVNDSLTVTPRMAGFAEFLNSAGQGACGATTWDVDVEQEVYDTGCTVLGVAPATPTQEFEVLYVNGGQLYFGARPVDGTVLDTAEARPKALQMPLRLAEGGATRQVGDGDLRQPTHVEIVTFRQVDGADPAEVRAFFEDITVRMNQNDTLLYRTVAEGPDGTWLCVNYWTSRADMETLNAQARNWSEAFAAMAKLADPSSFSLTSYAIDG